jgi:hypothetical protein
MQIHNEQALHPNKMRNHQSVLKPAPSKSLCFQKDTSVDLEWAFEGHASVYSRMREKVE